MLSAQFESSSISPPPMLGYDWGAMPDERQPSQPILRPAMPPPDYNDDRRREHEDRVIEAVRQMSSSLSDQIMGVRTELRETFKENKAETKERLDKLESRLSAVEKDSTAMSAKSNLIAGILGVVGAGVVEIIYSAFGHK